MLAIQLVSLKIVLEIGVRIMVMINFYHKREFLGGYSIHSEDIDHDYFVRTLFDLAEDYNVPRNEIKWKVERV